MAVRTTNYAVLVLDEFRKHGGLDRDGRLPETKVVVLHHGDTRWNAPTRLADLFRGSAPVGYQVVAAVRGGEPTPPTPLDLPSMVLNLARDRTPEEMRPVLRALARVIREAGEEDGITDPDRIADLADVVFQCETGEELIERARKI